MVHTKTTPFLLITNFRKLLYEVLIMLVGISIGAAALAYSWYVNTQKGFGGEAGEAGAQLSKATGSNIQIISVVENSQTVLVRNIGSSNLMGGQALVNGSVLNNSIGNISVGKAAEIQLGTYSLAEDDVVEIVGDPGGYDRAVVR